MWSWRLQPIAGPWDPTPSLTRNPWYGVQGHYDITSAHCDGRPAPIPPYNVFEVITADDYRLGGSVSWLFLRKLGPNDYYAGVRLMEDHDTDATITLTALSNGGASRIEEKGTLWGPYYSKNEYRLEHDRHSGAYKMTEAEYVREWDTFTGKIQETRHQCVYELMKGPPPTKP